MKTTLILLLMFPLMTLADIAPTPTYYRYQRIGFEVLPNASAQPGTPAEGLPVLAVLSLSLATGLFLCLCARKDLRAKTFHMAGFLGKWSVVFILRTLHGCCACIFLLSLRLFWECATEHSFRGVFPSLAISGGLLSVVLWPVLNRREWKRRFPSLFGMGIFIASSLAAVVLMVLLIIIGGTKAPQVCPYNLDPAPGWKYPIELTANEKALLWDRIYSLPSRMCEMVEDVWEKDPIDGRVEHARKTIVSILEGDVELRNSCTGIPVEMIVEHYFKVESLSLSPSRHRDFFYPRTTSLTSVLAAAGKHEVVLRAIELFNKKFMGELPRLEAEFEGTPYHGARYWNDYCEGMMGKAVREDPEASRHCSKLPIKAFSALIEFPSVNEWFGYSLGNGPNPEEKKKRDASKPHLARLRQLPEALGQW